MDDAFRSHGSAILKMIAEMAQMKEIFVRKKPVHTTSSPALDQVIVSHVAGFVMETMIASTKLTRTTVPQRSAALLNFNAPTRNSASMKAIDVMESVTAKTALMNKAVHPWHLISVTWKSPSSAKSRGCAFQSCGIVTAMLTVKMVVMNLHHAAKLNVHRTTSSATILNASSSPGYVMAVMTVEIILMKTADMLVLHRNSNVSMASGFAQELQIVASIYPRYAMESRIVLMELMKVLAAHLHHARATRLVAHMDVM